MCFHSFFESCVAILNYIALLHDPKTILHSYLEKPNKHHELERFIKDTTPPAAAIKFTALIEAASTSI